MMTVRSAHVLLFVEATIEDTQRGLWRFSLENVATGETFSASDAETVECSERLELLALVRGLEAIDQPAKVTLVTKSRYVCRGLKRGLADWRANAWQWERFGRVVPVRDHDLWRRVDRALRFHQVDCRLWQFNQSVGNMPAPHAEPLPERVAGGWLAAAARRKLKQAKDAAAHLGDALRPSGLAAG